MKTTDDWLEKKNNLSVVDEIALTRSLCSQRDKVRTTLKSCLKNYFQSFSRKEKITNLESFFVELYDRLSSFAP